MPLYVRYCQNIQMYLFKAAIYWDELELEWSTFVVTICDKLFSTFNEGWDTYWLDFAGNMEWPSSEDPAELKSQPFESENGFMVRFLNRILLFSFFDKIHPVSQVDKRTKRRESDRSSRDYHPTVWWGLKMKTNHLNQSSQRLCAWKRLGQK